MQVKHSKLSEKVVMASGLLVVALVGMATSGTISQVNAVSFQSVADMKFTFNPSLTVSLSSDDLVIGDLAPGNSADSNEITITVGTNTAYGYSLQATAGNSSYAGSANFNANDLVLTNGATVSSSETNKFTSLATNASVANMSSANPDTWGYAYATYDTANSTWNSYSNYSGLPVYTETNGAELISSDGVADSKSIKFKIAAKAGDSRAAGEYTNVVNFIAVANPKPPETIATATYMQDVEECPSTLTTGQVYTIKDSRDEQEYKVAKLADNKCWMVENLNLAGNTALSADDTDVTSEYITSYTSSTTESENKRLVKSGNKLVLPATQTITSGTTLNGGFDTDNYSYVFNSGNKENCGASGQNTPCYSYYSWDAATLGSGRSISSDNTDAGQSICPKGWKLPTSRTTSATNWQTTSDFYVLAHQYGLDSTTSTAEYDNGFYIQAGPGTTPNFLLAGYYSDSSFYDGGSNGYYWSSTSYSDIANARYLGFGSGSVSSAYGRYRGYGSSVRCLLKGTN